MYKRFIFRYYNVSIKTQRGDNGGFVCAPQPRGLSVKTVKIGKSVFMFNRGVGKSKGKPAGNTDRFLFEKSLVEEHMISVPHTDTGALVENTKASGRQQFKELGNKN